MDDLLAARSQMAMSLAFHIIFAAIGIAMPLLMIIAEWRWLRSRDEIYLTLAKRWAKGTAILFAVATLFILAVLLHYSTVISKLSEQNMRLAQRLALLEHRLREERQGGGRGAGAS